MVVGGGCGSAKLKRITVGAEVDVHAGGEKWSRVVSRTVGYLGASEPHAHFGIGVHTRVDRIVVRWPDGVREVFSGRTADQLVELEKGQGEP